jgi:hypothetical protein
MELLRMMQQEQRQRQRARGAQYARSYRQFFPAKAATEAPKQMNGIKLNANGTVMIHGTTYSRDHFRAKLQEIVETMQSDPASAYRDRKNPNHQQTVEEISLAYKFLNNELSPQDETEIVSEWHAAEETTEVADTLLPHQEIAQILGTPEGRIALQRSRAGQPLDARQAAIVARHNELEAANNAQAYREQASESGTFKTTRPHMIPAELHAIERITDVRERVHAIRQQRAAWRDDKASPYNDVSHPEHKNYVGAMSRLYQEEEALERQPEDPE